MARVLVIHFPNISKLRDGVVLVKTSTFAMSQALSRVLSLVRAAVVSVAIFLDIRVGRVTVKRRVPIVVNCLINPALILPLVLITVDSTIQSLLLALLTSLKSLLWRSRI